MSKNKIEIKNKKAWHDYEFIDKYVAGIELYGTEVKAIRESKASLVDSYCYFRGDELFIRMHISEYSLGTFNNHDPKRERKLLLTRKELDKLHKNSQNKGLTIIPLRIFFNDKGFAKMEIALSKGRKEYDKRENLKDKDNKRELDRIMRK